MVIVAAIAMGGRAAYLARSLPQLEVAMTIRIGLRGLIAALGGAATAWQLLARAQEPSLR